MSIWLDENSAIVVQGMTGSEGMKHTRRMLASGANVVGGVNARKAGQKVDVDGTTLPVFGCVADAMAETGANVTVGFVPPAFTKDSVIEAIDAQIPLAVVITEGVPVHDTATFWAYAQGKATRIVGPNCPGVISPGRSNAGIIPADITKPGRIGLVSKSGTLTYQMMYELRDIGFSTCVGIGGDPIIGTTHIDCLEAFEADAGDRRDRHDRRDRRRRRGAGRGLHPADVRKPVVGYVAGFTAPEGKTMGHAGAIVSGSSGTARPRRTRSRPPGCRSARRRARPPPSCASCSADGAGPRRSVARGRRRALALGAEASAVVASCGVSGHARSSFPCRAAGRGPAAGSLRAPDGLACPQSSVRPDEENAMTFQPPSSPPGGTPPPPPPPGGQWGHRPRVVPAGPVGPAAAARLRRQDGQPAGLGILGAGVLAFIFSLFGYYKAEAFGISARHRERVR